jgi:hypothetical protein
MESKVWLFWMERERETGDGVDDEQPAAAGVLTRSVGIEIGRLCIRA